LTGRVVAFDEHAGLGLVRDDATGAEHPFHCTAIADGSRTIEAGSPVEFDLVAGGLGRWEAAQIAPL